jgi:hypothetical protein
MALLLINRLLSQALIAVFLWALLMQVQAATGQRIEVIGQTNSLELPPSRRSIEELSRSTDFLGPRLQAEPGYAPVLPPPGVSSPVINKNLRDYLDQKKNWMLQPPRTNERDEMKRILGVKDYQAPDVTRNSGRDRFAESDRSQKRPGAQENSDRNNRTSETDPLSRMGADSGSWFREGPAGIIPELNPALLFETRIGPEGMFDSREKEPRAFGLPQFGGTVGQPVSQSSDREKNQGQKEFERMLNQRQPVVSRWNDPINQQSDATRSILNPITARRPSVPAPEQAPTRSEDAFAASTAMPSVTPRHDFLAPTRSMPLGGSSLAPVIAAPQTAPLVQPKPAVLEIPRPKF